MDRNTPIAGLFFDKGADLDMDDLGVPPFLGEASDQPSMVMFNGYAVLC